MSQICAIFGGSGGIGASIVKQFFVSGHKVCVLARDSEKVRVTIASCTASRNDCANTPVGVQCDIRNEESIKEAFDKIQQDVGRVTVLVNAAGINIDNLLIKNKADQMEDILNTNLKGVMFTCKYALKHMMQEKKGNIINIGSIIGSRGNVGQTVYGASKAGLVGFTKSLAKEVGPRGIRVNCVAPGFIETDMTSELPEKELHHIQNRIPLKRLGQPSDVADMALFLLQASYITGQVLHVDGGLNITF